MAQSVGNWAGKQRVLGSSPGAANTRKGLLTPCSGGTLMGAWERPPDALDPPGVQWQCVQSNPKHYTVV